MATEILFAGKGEPAFSEEIVPPEPSLPDPLQVGDFVITIVAGGNLGTGTVTVKNWESIFNAGSASGWLGIFYRVYFAGMPAPEILLTGWGIGENIYAQSFAWRGVKPVSPVDQLGELGEFITPDIGPIGGIDVKISSMILAIGFMLGGWGSVAPLEGEVDWIEIEDFPISSPTINLSLVVNWAVTTENVSISPKTFIVSVSPSNDSKGILLSLLIDSDAFSAANDLVLYCAELHPQDDDAMVGGAIDTSMRANFVQLAAVDDIEVVSDTDADIGVVVTLVGRDVGRNELSQSVLLNGTSPVSFDVIDQIERVIAVYKSDFTVGNVTVRRGGGGATIGVIPPTERGFRMIFASAYPDPGAAKMYYEKVFLRNNHPTQRVFNGVISETADPEGNITFLLSAALNDVFTIASRLTAPAASITLDPDIFDGNDKDIPGDLNPLSAIGIWLRLDVAAAEPRYKSTYSLDLDGDIIFVP